MADVVIIDKVEDDDYQGKAFKKVTDKTGKVFNVKYGQGGKLKEKWPLLVGGTTIEIEWGVYNEKPFVRDFKVVAEAGQVAELPSQKPDSLPPQPGEELPPPAPQAVGMMTKEIGDMMRAEMLGKIFGAKIAVELTKWYRSQALGITRIPYEGKDLPVFK